MTIRKMTAGDYPRVYALWLSCKGMGLNDQDDSADGIAAFLDRNPETCFVAEEGDRIAGVLLAGSDGRRGYIYHTAVRPDCRRQGIGHQLVQACLEGFRRIGIRKVALVAFTRNAEGNAFWEREGFTVRDDLTYRNRALLDLIRIDT